MTELKRKIRFLRKKAIDLRLAGLTPPGSLGKFHAEFNGGRLASFLPH